MPASHRRRRHDACVSANQRPGLGSHWPIRGRHQWGMQGWDAVNRCHDVANTAINIPSSGKYLCYHPADKHEVRATKTENWLLAEDVECISGPMPVFDCPIFTRHFFPLSLSPLWPSSFVRIPVSKVSAGPPWAAEKVEEVFVPIIGVLRSRRFLGQSVCFLMLSEELQTPCQGDVRARSDLVVL